MPSRERAFASFSSRWPDLWPLMRDDRWGVAALVAASVPGGFLQAGLVTVVAETAVAMAGGEDEVTANVASLSLSFSVTEAIVSGFIMAGLMLLLNMVTSYYPAKIVANTQARFRNLIFGRFVHTSWHVQALERNGHLQEVMTTQINRTAMLLLALAKGVPEALILLGLLVSAFLLAPYAAGAMVVFGGALFALLRPLANSTRRHAHTHALASESFAAAVNESVQLGEEYHVFGVEDVQAQVVADQVEGVRAPFMRSKYMVDLVGGVYASLVLVLLVAGLAALRLFSVGELGAIGAVVLILLRALSSGKDLQSTYTTLHNNLPYLERALEALARYGTATVQTGNRPLPELRSFAFDHVSYRYTPEEPALDDVSFEVAAGDAVGIVGPSGAGKSTVVQILLRLRAPIAGRYLVNGIEASEYDRDAWTRAVAYVPQQPKLILGTVADNIRFHRADVTDEDVERAARLAHLHDEIVAWPDGYAKMVGQGASAMSGGQRQRLCLARALVTDPKVIVLDEPTSALDPTSERLVQQSLMDVRGRGVTLFIVAHRAATLEFIDTLLVLEGGRVTHAGPAGEASAGDGFLRSVLDAAGGTIGTG